MAALPAFTAWDSGVLPYPLLLVTQAAILAAMLATIGRLDDKARPRLGAALLGLGAVYATSMIARGVIGGFDLLDHPWFEAPLSTPIHLVLAAFLTILGGHWSTCGSALARVAVTARWTVYPLTMSGALGVFAWALASGMPTLFAAYFAAVLGCSVVLAAERLLPYRSLWLPTRWETGTDVLYLLVVQILLPGALTAGAVWAQQALMPMLPTIWPTEWPIAAQLLAMILAADFARYWLHRAAHRWSMLWRLHAVHHAPEGLHATNVGRFHPLEKALQFVCDALPFIVLGVPEAVVAGYLVFYAINGFFQHANVDVRLGLLNWIVSGPELHRWHHARDPALSDHNFGNNLIVWDGLFGTRFLPEKRTVKDLGLLNRDYPQSFVSQLASPLWVHPNRGDVQ